MILALRQQNNDKFFAMIGGIFAFNQEYNGTDPFFFLSWTETQ